LRKDKSKLKKREEEKKDGRQKRREDLPIGDEKEESGE